MTHPTIGTVRGVAAGAGFFSGPKISSVLRLHHSRSKPGKAGSYGSSGSGSSSSRSIAFTTSSGSIADRPRILLALSFFEGLVLRSGIRTGIRCVRSSCFSVKPLVNCTLFNSLFISFGLILLFGLFVVLNFPRVVVVATGGVCFVVVTSSRFVLGVGDIRRGF